MIFRKSFSDEKNTIKMSVFCKYLIIIVPRKYFAKTVKKWLTERQSSKFIGALFFS